MSRVVSAAVVIALGGVALLTAERRQDTAGAEITTRMVEALGGMDHLRSLDGWIVEGAGRENLSAELGGIRYDAPTWRPHREIIAVDSGNVAWERHTPRNDNSLRWRRFIYTPHTFGVIDWTMRRGSVSKRPTAAATRNGIARRIPHLLVLEAATRAENVTRRQDAGRFNVIELRLSDTDTPLEISVERLPAVPRRASYRTHMPGLGEVTVSWQWDGWKPDGTVKLAPSGHTVDVNSVRYQEVKYTRYAANTPEAAAMMQVAPELVLERASAAPPPPPAGPATGEVAPGVHVMNVRGFLVMFVEFKDFIVAIEAPESAVGLETLPATSSQQSVTAEYLALIRKTIPDKPVRFAVVSHHHSDHLGGVRTFAEAGATILTAPGDVGAVGRALGTPAAAARGAAVSEPSTKIEPVPRRRVITDGARTLEVVNVGKNPHTAENLFVWLPNERLLFQGDLFYYDEHGAFPPSGRETMNRFFARWLRSNGFAPKAVYGVHYPGAAGPDALALAAQ